MKKAMSPTASMLSLRLQCKGSGSHLRFVSLTEPTVSLHSSLANDALTDVGGLLHLSPRLLLFTSVS